MKIHHIRLQTQIFNNYKTEKVLQKQSQNPPLNSSNCSSRVLNIFFRELHPKNSRFLDMENPGNHNGFRVFRVGIYFVNTAHGVDEWT